MTDPVVVQSVGSMYATFTDPTGVEWQLTNIDDSIGWFTTPGPGGWGAAAYEYTLDPVPRGGDSVRFIRQKSAQLTWPLHIYGDTYVEFTDNFRNLRRAFLLTVHLGKPGTLKVARPDGTARVIDVYYQDGFEGKPGEYWLSANPVLTLLAPDGYWRDITPVTVPRSLSVGANFLNPFPSISSSQVLGQLPVINPGDVLAWPTWTISGPSTGLTATHNGLGQRFNLTYTLNSGEQATINTLQPSVRGPAGQNIISALDYPYAYLWPLLPGSNDVTFTVAGAGPGTSIVLSFYPRYEGI